MPQSTRSWLWETRRQSGTLRELEGMCVPKSLQLGSVLDVAEIAGWGIDARLRESVLDCLLVVLQDKRRMVAELPEVLE